MACIGIEELPHDALREIMTRVAGPQGGATDLARAFAVSKTFRSFVTDETVLRAVCFEDMLSCLDGKYELLSDLDGLVARCWKAGNLNSELILSKVILVCASKLSLTKLKATDIILSPEDYFSSDIEKEVRLVNHFVAQNRYPTDLHILVRDFLSRSEMRDLLEMSCYLQDFAILFTDPHRKAEQERFLIILVNSFNNSSLQLLTNQPSNIEKYNALCLTAHSKMKHMGMDEEYIGTLLECTVEWKDADHDLMVVRLDTAMSIMTVGREVAYTHGKDDALWTLTDALHNADMLSEYFEYLIDMEEFLDNGRRILLLSFDTLFDLASGRSGFPEPVSH